MPHRDHPSMKTLLKTPAVAPSCFGKPERCAECSQCGLRHHCYERHAEEEFVFLLPVDRGVAHAKSWGSVVVPEQ